MNANQTKAGEPQKGPIQSEFKTRKAAATYLRARGWVRNGNSLGDWLFQNHLMAHGNQWRIIVQLNTGKWQIQHIQPLAVAATGEKFVSSKTVGNIVAGYNSATGKSGVEAFNQDGGAQ